MKTGTSYARSPRSPGATAAGRGDCTFAGLAKAYGSYEELIGEPADDGSTIRLQPDERYMVVKRRKQASTSSCEKPLSYPGGSQEASGGDGTEGK